MYIVSTLLQAKPGRAADVGAGAVKLAGLFGKAGAAGVAVWRPVAGMPYGSFLVSGRFDTFAAGFEAGNKVGADPEFAALSPVLGDALLVPAENFTNRIVAASPSYAPKPFTSLAVAVAAGGQLRAALAVANEIIAFSEKVAGMGGVVTAAVGGPTNQIGLIFSADDAAAWEAASTKLLADPGWLDLVDKAGVLVQPGTAQRALIAQIA